MTRHKDTHAVAHLALFPFLPFPRFHSTRHNLFYITKLHFQSLCTAFHLLSAPSLNFKLHAPVSLCIPYYVYSRVWNIFRHVNFVRRWMDNIIITNDILLTGWVFRDIFGKFVFFFFFRSNNFPRVKFVREFSTRGRFEGVKVKGRKIDDPLLTQ